MAAKRGLRTNEKGKSSEHLHHLPEWQRRMLLDKQAGACYRLGG